MTKITFKERENKVMDHFLRNDKGWINMETVKILLPNIEEIVYYAVFALENDTSFFADSVFESILSLIVESNKLRKIRICIHPASQHYAKKWIQKYKQKFSKHYWIIKFQRQLCRVPTILRVPTIPTVPNLAKTRDKTEIRDRESLGYVLDERTDKFFTSSIFMWRAEK
eukprot:219287_1